MEDYTLSIQEGGDSSDDAGEGKGADMDSYVSYVTFVEGTRSHLGEHTIQVSLPLSFVSWTLRGGFSALFSMGGIRSQRRVLM